MKPEIHPEYREVNVTCSCGNSFETRSTIAKNELQVEVCSQCDPFYTGKQKILDSAGQIDKFRKRFGGGKS
jgi:large subunit ribosomal protein L31